MRGGTLLCLALVATLVLSGCASSGSTASTSGTGSADASASDGGSSNGGASGTGSGTGGGSTASSTGSATGAAGANRAPVISSFAANLTAGKAPLKVKFTFNATDADRDNLTYTLFFGVAKTNVTGKLGKLGGNATYTYAAAGNYTPMLIVSDGKLLVNKTATKVIVTAAAAVVTETQDESDSDLMAANQCQAFHLGAPLEMMFTLKPGTLGLPYHATVEGPGLVGIRIGFFNAAGSNVGGSSFMPGAFEFSGTVPAGAVEGAVEGCGVGPYTATYHAG